VALFQTYGCVVIQNVEVSIICYCLSVIGHLSGLSFSKHDVKGMMKQYSV
jgi:hypothetical protein